MSKGTIYFDDFVPGRILGRLSESISDRQLLDWDELFGGSPSTGDSLPMGLSTVLMMRAYLQIVSPRPPGNLHTRQRLHLHSPVRIGEFVETTIVCTGKEMRGTRRLVELSATGKGDQSRPIYDGIITLYWAA